jgi:hypothetical protein
MEMTTEMRKENIKKTKAKYGKNHWWASKDPKELFWGQINEPILIIDFGKFHEAAEKALGRPVWSHEFARPDVLIQEYQGKIPKANFADVMDKIPEGKKIITVVHD